MGSINLQSLNCCCTDINKEQAENQAKQVISSIKRPDIMSGNCCGASNRSNKDPMEFSHREINKSYYNDLVVM